MKMAMTATARARRIESSFSLLGLWRLDYLRSGGQGAASHFRPGSGIRTPPKRGIRARPGSASAASADVAAGEAGQAGGGEGGTEGGEDGHGQRREPFGGHEGDVLE